MRKDSIAQVPRDEYRESSFPTLLYIAYVPIFFYTTAYAAQDRASTFDERSRTTYLESSNGFDRPPAACLTANIV